MNHQKYFNLSIEEIADLPHFREWVINPTAENEQYWEQIKKENLTLKTKIETAKKIVQSVHNQYDKSLSDRAVPNPNFAKLLTNIVRLEKEEQQGTLTIPKVQRRWAIAASVAILLSVGLWFFVEDKTTPTQEWTVHQTDFGEWKKLELPDGSIAHLNANSELRLQNNWQAGKLRQIWLEGEAYFEVQKKPQTNAKFQVITSALTIEVLGTMFNVNSRKNNTKVFLEEGEIALQTATKRIDLKPNDYIDFTKGETLTIHQETAKNIGISWKEGTLLLEKRTVKKLLQRLEEIYGYSFKVNNPELLSEIKTLAVPMDKLEIVLPILERTLGATIQMDGNLLVIEKMSER